MERIIEIYTKENINATKTNSKNEVINNIKQTTNMQHTNIELEIRLQNISKII